MILFYVEVYFEQIRFIFPKGLVSFLAQKYTSTLPNTTLMNV